MFWDLLYIVAIVLIVVGLGGLIGLWAVGGGWAWVAIGLVFALVAYLFGRGRSRLS